MKRFLSVCILALSAQLGFAAGITLLQTPGSLYREIATIVIRWQEPIEANLHFGLTSGSYPFQSSATGNRQLTIVPKNEGMAPGVYYGVIASGSLTSREFKIFVESSKAPNMLSPANNSTISSATPLFSWDPVPGVPFYHLILSDQAVTLKEDQNGELQLDGGNIIWQIITARTTATYGEPDPSGFFGGINRNLPPLLEGLEYNWVVLNNYNNHPAFSSIVQAGVSGFRARLNVSLAKPALLSPQNNVVITGTSITFRWSAVVGAVSYQLLLSESIEQDGSKSSYVVWAPLTTETFVDLPARQMLKGGQYFWRVVALDQAGRGSGSDSRLIQYSVPEATLHFQSTDTQKTTLPRVEIEIVPRNGSSEISKLLTADNGTLDQPVQPGDYVIYGHKEGFADTSVTAQVRAGETKAVSLVLRELVQSISGQVVDKTIRPISSAGVVLSNYQQGVQARALTDAAGGFNIFVVPGTWYLWAEKQGYFRSDTLSVQLSADQQKMVPKLKLEEKAARLAGFVKTSGGIPVVSSRVRAENGSDRFDATTNSIGRFELLLHAGSWEIQAHKDGYAPSNPRIVSLPAGQTTALSPDLVLNSNSAIVSGIVSTLDRALGPVRIEAIPLRGQVIETSSNLKGAYLLSLSGESYQLRTLSKSFLPQNDIYINLSENQTVSGLDLLMAPAFGFIKGQVRNGNAPVAGAIVTNGLSYDTTKATGQYSLPAAAGPHLLHAFYRGLISSADPAVTLKTPALNNVNFSMKTSAVIEGTIVSGGKNIPYAKIVASAGNKVFSQPAQKDGSYWISVPAGVWSVRAEKVGFEPGRFEGIAVNSGQTISGVDFNLIFAGAVLRGRISDPVGGGIQNAVVDIKEAGLYAMSDRLGNYAVSLNPGAYTLFAHKAGFVEQQKSATLTQNGTTTLNFTLTAQAVVRGIIQDRNGRALDNIEVKAVNSDTLSGRTDFAGEYSLFLNPGSYQLTADQLGYARGQTSVSVAFGDRVTKNFTLAEAPNEIARIKGRILDSENHSLGSVGIQVSGQENRTIYTDTNGLFDTEVLETGKNYTLEPFSAGRFFVPPRRTFAPLTANHNNQNFASGLYGDVSANEKISSFDGSIVLRVKAEQDVSPYYQNMPRDSIAADVSGNSQVSPFDASLIFRYAAGLIDEFPTQGSLLEKRPFAKSEGARLAMQLSSADEYRIVIDIVMEKMSGVYSGEIWLSYKTEDFHFLKADKSALLQEGYFFSSHRPGSVKLVFATIRPLPEEGPLARLFFEKRAPSNKAPTIRLAKARINEEPVKVESALTAGAQFDSFRLFANYPNPFNSTTVFRYLLPTKADNSAHRVEIKVYNLLGQTVKTLLSTQQEAGYHEIAWDGGTGDGYQSPSGIYIFRITAGPYRENRKLLLVR